MYAILNLASKFRCINKEQLRERRRVAVPMPRVCLHRECAHRGDVLCRECYLDRREVIGEVLLMQIFVGVPKAGWVAHTLIFVVPGMGMMSSPCARSHASATWLDVAPYFSPSAASPSVILRMFGKLVALYLCTYVGLEFGNATRKIKGTDRSTERRKSFSGRSSGERCA
jgi:hypothetical protein